MDDAANIPPPPSPQEQPPGALVPTTVDSMAMVVDGSDLLSVAPPAEEEDHPWLNTVEPSNADDFVMKMTTSLRHLKTTPPEIVVAMLSVCKVREEYAVARINADMALRIKELDARMAQQQLEAAARIKELETSTEIRVKELDIESRRMAAVDMFHDHHQPSTQSGRRRSDGGEGAPPPKRPRRQPPVGSILGASFEWLDNDNTDIWCNLRCLSQLLWKLCPETEQREPSKFLIAVANAGTTFVRGKRGFRSRLIKNGFDTELLYASADALSDGSIFREFSAAIWPITTTIPASIAESDPAKEVSLLPSNSSIKRRIFFSYFFAGFDRGIIVVHILIFSGVTHNNRPIIVVIRSVVGHNFQARAGAGTAQPNNIEDSQG